MIEIIWGKPLHLIAQTGETKTLSTIEQAKYMLKNRWPEDVEASSRDVALAKIQDAMECLGSVGCARRAFISAAKRAGYRAESMAV